MSKPIYKVLFSGEFADTLTHEQAKSILKGLLKTTPDNAEKLLDGKQYILKKTTTKEQAAQVVTHLEKLGLKVSICNESPEEPSTDPTEDKSSKSRIIDKVSNMAGVEKLNKSEVKGLFSETFKKRSFEEIEDYLIHGTTTTTPHIGTVNTEWPRPWLFMRSFTALILVYIAFLYAFDTWLNPKLLPGLIFIGVIAVPVSVLLFFYEMNAPRNVSILVALKLMVVGGILSLIISLMMFDLTTSFNWLGASVAGLAEEPGKLLALLFISNATRYPYIHNGLLFGAAVGTGFAVFESAGYAFEILLLSNVTHMLDNISLRGILSPFAHIVWTSMVAGALWRVKEGRRFDINMLFDWRFLRVFFIAIVLHMIWNSPFELPFYGKYLILGGVSWIIILAMMQEGLAQIRSKQ